MPLYGKKGVWEKSYLERDMTRALTASIILFATSLISGGRVLPQFALGDSEL